MDTTDWSTDAGMCMNSAMCLGTDATGAGMRWGRFSGMDAMSVGTIGEAKSEGRDTVQHSGLGRIPNRCDGDHIPSTICVHHSGGARSPIRHSGIYSIHHSDDHSPGSPLPK